jgi:hypothetical protein
MEHHEPDLDKILRSTGTERFYFGMAKLVGNQLFEVSKLIFCFACD